MTDPHTIARSLSPAQRAILKTGTSEAESDYPYRSNRLIGLDCGLDVPDVRAAVQVLRGVLLLKFERGLVNEDGRFFGSGHCLTPLGQSVRAIIEEEEL